MVSFLPPVTSTTFPPLSIGGSSGFASTLASTPPTLGQVFPIGPGYTPISYKLVAKITGGQFIKLADLLSDNFKAQEAEPQTYLEGKFLVTSHKKQVVEITDIVTWIEAFSIFCLVLCHSFPSHWPGLSRYKLLIIQTAKHFGDKFWLNYATAFRKGAAGSTDWSRMNADLYNFHRRAPSALTSAPGLAPLPLCQATQALANIATQGMTSVVAGHSALPVSSVMSIVQWRPSKHLLPLPSSTQSLVLLFFPV